MRPRDGTGQLGHAMPKHVWVTLEGSSTGRLPGILLEWRQTGSGWEGFVVCADGGGNVKPRAYMEWLPADQIDLATGSEMT